jgi:hypothetical protein
VKTLVYIAALAPDEGEIVADVFHLNQPHPLAPMLEPDEHGLIYLPDGAFAAALGGEIGAAVCRTAANIACLHHGASESSALERSPDFVSRGRAGPHVFCDTQRYMAERMRARVHSRPVDHAPIVTAPEVAVDVMRQAIAEATRA